MPQKKYSRTILDLGLNVYCSVYDLLCIANRLRSHKLRMNIYHNLTTNHTSLDYAIHVCKSQMSSCKEPSASICYVSHAQLSYMLSDSFITMHITYLGLLFKKKHKHDFSHYFIKPKHLVFLEFIKHILTIRMNIRRFYIIKIDSYLTKCVKNCACNYAFLSLVCYPSVSH